ncbi:unnamed protein product [Ectocarpus sp. 8 AP-2014]
MANEEEGSSDYAVLCAFVATAEGTGWDIAVKDINKWSNIACDHNRVVQIDFGGSGEGGELLPGKALDGRLPKDLWTLNMIQSVKLRGTRLSGKIPEITTCHDHLVLLDLSYNRLDGKLPRLGLLRSLTHLYMHKNSLTGTLADGDLEGCKDLELVNLSMNRLSGGIPASFVDLKKLHSLHLYINRLTGIIPIDFVKMSSLQDMQIGHQAGLQLPPGTDYPGNEFKKWMKSRTKVSVTDLKIAPITKSAWAALDTKGDQTRFPEEMGAQKVHREGALLDTEAALLDTTVEEGGQAGTENGHPVAPRDILAFDKYANVLVDRLSDPDMWPVSLGIYAQWGAGKSSLLRFILRRFERIPSESAKPRCFKRFLLSSMLGSILLEAWAGLRDCCASKPSEPAHGNPPQEERKLTCVLASFDAWLFADSDVLWAVLISTVFDQVERHPSFGKGAVRYFRWRRNISSEITMERLCFAAVGALIVIGFAVALRLIIEAIGGLDSLLAKALAFVGLAGVPISVVLLTIKAMPAAFQGQGEIILNKAKSMHESVGSARLGFMSEVQEEIKILLDMLKDRSTENNKFALVVSIDNLDRCPHRNIVKVLEAVHLLLELDQTNVIVILALDPRVIISAIEADLGPEVRNEVSGSEYLDKIIHVPFCVPFGTHDQRRSLTNSWLGVTEANAHEHAADQRSEERVVNSPTGETKRSERGDQPSPRSPTLEAATNTNNIDSRISSLFHIPEEIHEFHRLCGEIVATPRKMKRILNIYGIQRALAKELTPGFRTASAMKLLRWAALCEFWPFRTACLVGSAKLAIDTREEHLGDESAPLEYVYMENTSKVMKTMLNEKQQVDDEPTSGGFSRSAARRLLGMDESDQAFLRLLQAKPLLCVGDFMERLDNPGLLRFSFNLNPAMVATVGAWVRSEFS